MSWQWVALIFAIAIALVIALWAPYVDWDRDLEVYVPCGETPCPVVETT